MSRNLSYKNHNTLSATQISVEFFFFFLKKEFFFQFSFQAQGALAVLHARDAGGQPDGGGHGRAQRRRRQRDDLHHRGHRGGRGEVLNVPTNVVGVDLVVGTEKKRTTNQKKNQPQ